MSSHAVANPYEIIRRDGRFHPAAFEFLHAGLSAAVSRVHGALGEDEPQHVTGRELADGLRDVALARWGLMARPVLRSWGIRCTRDFGEMVFLLIGAGAMGRQESDTIEDFDDVYDFDIFDQYIPMLDGLGRAHGGD